MKRVDFENDSITGNILNTALPMLAAQFVSLLYNIVDRIYIARIPGIGTKALGAVGLCFPIIVMITAFANLFGSGGAPLFSISRGAGQKKHAAAILHLSFTMLCLSALVLMTAAMVMARPLLTLFGASSDTIGYALPYLMIFLLGTLPSMLATGLNPFINAQGYPTFGMLSISAGAAANLLLDPLFIFVFRMGIVGAAAATVLSQILCAAIVLFFLGRKAEYRIKLLSFRQLKKYSATAKNIISLGTAGFIMQVTNSLVTICCNSVLSDIGGDIYVSVMTIITSIRQMVETPIYAIAEGASPIISFHYGARKAAYVGKAIRVMAVLILSYTVLSWSVIIFAPESLIRIFSSDPAMRLDASRSLNLYFAAFIFMDLQYIGQTTFKSLNKKKQAVFFSLLRKVFIVVPLTYLLPRLMNTGTDGVFLAEPVSNVIGGGLCFATMLLCVIPELRRMNCGISQEG